MCVVQPKKHMWGVLYIFTITPPPQHMTRIYLSKPALPFFFLLIFLAVLYGLG